MIKSPIILLDPFGQIISHSQHFKERNEQAEYYIQAVAKPKDIVLFENDLPDNYNE